MIMDALTCYRDAIQFVHDQTIKYMNRGNRWKEVNYMKSNLYHENKFIITDTIYILVFLGLHPDEITQQVKLPPVVETNPFLREFYGTVEWSSKAVFGHYLGWYSGKASELHPLHPTVCTL